jgi:hypothetical protein
MIQTAHIVEAMREAMNAEAGRQQFTEAAWPNWEKIAQAALSTAFPMILDALREPTPEMLEAAKPEPAHLYGKDGRDESYTEQMKLAVQVDRMVAASIWRAMIDAIRSTGMRVEG